MTIHEAQQQLLLKLGSIYGDREPAAIADLVMEHITGWRKIDRIINKNDILSLQQQELLEKYSAELLEHKPVQYVLHEAWFGGMKFYVDENVLIPRPETEELVEWVVEETRSSSWPNAGQELLTILDIGTGSGCIPIALKKKLPGARIFSCDVSEAALNIAKRNARENSADIHFLHLDFLNNSSRALLPQPDIIVSNPPYVPIGDKAAMMQNVVAYEPHLALFVEDSNPLIFYDAIACFATEKLSTNGKLFIETHENQARNVKQMLAEKGFQQVEIKKDMQGRDRMIKATMLL